MLFLDVFLELFASSYLCLDCSLQELSQGANGVFLVQDLLIGSLCNGSSPVLILSVLVVLEDHGQQDFIVIVEQGEFRET